MRLPTSLLSRTRAGISLLLGLLMASTPVAAQQGTGTIRGTVTQTGSDQALAGVIVTVDGAPLFSVGLSSPPFDSPCRTSNIQVTRTIAVGGATGHVEGTYTVSTNLK